MKLLAYLFAFSTFFVGVAIAQPPGRGDGMERMAVLLDLNEYQQAEVQRILEERWSAARASREAMRESGQSPSREEMVAHRQEIAANTLTQLQSVLTPEQITKFQVLTERQRGPGRHGGGRHGQPPADL